MKSTPNRVISLSSPDRSKKSPSKERESAQLSRESEPLSAEHSPAPVASRSLEEQPFSSEHPDNAETFKGPASRYRDLDIEKIVEEGQSRNEQMTPQFRSIQTVDIFDKQNRHAADEEVKGVPA